MEEILTPETVLTLERALVTSFAQPFKIIYMSNDGKYASLFNLLATDIFFSNFSALVFKM